MFNVDELLAISRVLNWANMFHRTVETIGANVSVDDKLVILNIAKRIEEEHKKLVKESKETADNKD